MRVVIPGWSMLAERFVSLRVLQRHQRMSEAGRLRHRPWWRGLCPRWRVVRL